MDETQTETDGELSHVLVLSGPGGSGKTTALRALEDIGYFCIDNLPMALMKQLIDVMHRTPGVERVALVVDARERLSFDDAVPVLQDMIDAGEPVELVFLDSDDKTLLRRYSETRRRHPLAGEDGNVPDGIAEERRRLGPLEALAHASIETSSLTVHDLKRVIQQRYQANPEESGLTITTMSFGFKHGTPVEADLMFDVRFLPNPYFDPALREQRGTDAAVSAFVLTTPTAVTFMSHLEAMLAFLLPLYEKEGKRYLTIAIGCTGGHHRSVALVESLASRLRSEHGIRPRVVHRDTAR